MMSRRVLVLECVVTSMALLTLRTVQGFPTTDFVGQQSVQQTELFHQQPIMSPVNALVDEALRVLDAGNDGEIALSEVETYLSGLFSPDSETVGYLLTLASLIDVDENGRMNRYELRRATLKLVNLAGLQQVGKGFEMLSSSQGFGPTTALVDYIAVDFENVLDSDNDGLVTLVEISGRFGQGHYYQAAQVATDSDANSDGYLNQTEARQFLDTLASEYLWALRHVYLYFRVTKLAGKEAADMWLNAGH